MEELLNQRRESTRQRSLRIPLDYHRTRGPLAAWRLVLTLACCVAGGIYLAWVLAGGKPGISQVSPGTLAKDHARWDSDCKACHVPFVPQREDAKGTRGFSRLIAGGNLNDDHRDTDAKCSACHKSAGIHHAHQKPEDVESCAGCHRDHEGREFDMVRMDDAHCTECHASIAGHRTTPAASPIVNVTAFAMPSSSGDSGHPTFRSLQIPADPGNIRFSHQLHMTLGQLYPGQEPAKGKRLVQLACDACHQPETAESGAYMRPINYEQHCRGCHPLTMAGQPDAAIPHGLGSRQLENFVRGAVAADHAPVPSTPPRVIPGKAPKTDPASLDAPAEMLFDQKMAAIRTNKCSQCHSWQSQQPEEVLPARIPATWLQQHARFNHEKHRNAATCVDCHPAAAQKLPAEGVPGKLADDDAVMIPNIDNCIRCHAPTSALTPMSGTGATVAARFDCAECHRYHQTPIEQKPLRQKAVSRDPTQRTDEWLKIRLVADRPSTVPTPNQQHPFVGTQSCSTTGCHGAGGGRGSPSAFTRFANEDPHGSAFLLLYAESSEKILRKLRGTQSAQPIKTAYFAELQQRCLGCHATPAADPARVSLPTSYLAGVSCESCHGAAATWEFSHFQRGAKPSGLAKLEDPSQAAKVCAECHIGPKQMLGKTYDVNHDLIAAGHPRLTLEFEAQLANLPAHWSPAKDTKSHFEAWRAGELATAAQQEVLHSSRDPLEFASYRCFDCHHSIGPLNSLTRSANERVPAIRAAIAPLHSSVILTPQSRQFLSQPEMTTQQQQALLVKLLDATTSSSSPSGTCWEEHVQFSLALSAFVVDQPDPGDLGKHADSLRDLLANSFPALPSDRKMHKEKTFAGSRYDSPTSFDPSSETLKQLRDQMGRALAKP